MKQILFLFFILHSAFSFSEEVVYSLDECYVISKELGHGAFGVVYEVQDSQGNSFALKKHLPYGYSGKIIRIYEDSYREFSIGQVLDHPNIIKSIDWFIDELDFEYVLLELVNGENVHDVQKKSLTFEQSLKICLQLIDALEYSLNMGYIYLDMHSKNVMITDNFDMKIIDLSSFFSLDELNMLKAKGKKGHSLREEKLHRFMARHKGLTEQIDRYFFYINFNDYVRLVIKILNRAEIDRETKINLFAEIKKVEWNYDEDFDESIELPVSEYLNRLKQILAAKIGI
jgi:hypothetical protein